MSINIKKEAIYFTTSFLDLLVIGTVKRLALPLVAESLQVSFNHH